MRKNINIANRNVLLLPLIFIFPFLIRILFLLMIKGDPVFVMPIIDSLEFDIWGYQIFNGKLLWTELNNHPPLYAYYIALVYKIFGYNPLIVVLSQYVMASLSIVLAHLVAEKLFNKSIALICSLLLSTYWFAIYVNSFLFSENLSIFLNILLVYLLLFMSDSVKKYLICGVVFGLSFICRPQVMLFALFILFWFFIRKIPFKQWREFYIIFLLGLILVAFPVFLRNYVISGQFTLRTQVGANFYIGSQPQFKGTNLHIQIGREWEDFISMPHHAFKRDVTDSESNVYFLKEMFKIIRQDPLQWAKLILAKGFSITTGREFLRTEDVYVFEKYFLKTPYCFISTKLLFLLACIGMLFSLRYVRQYSLIYLFIMTQLPMFFLPMKTRYFMGVIPFLVIFAAAAIYQLFDALRKKQTVGVAMIGLIVVLYLISFYNPLGNRHPDASETYYAIAKNYVARLQYQKAEEYFLRTIDLNPENLSAHNDLGVMLMNLGEHERALTYFRNAMKIDATVLYPKLNYEICLKKMNKMVP